MFQSFWAATAAAMLAAFLSSGPVRAQSTHHDQEHGATALTPQSFDAQLAQAMERMHAAMAAAPVSGQPERDFLATMIPHHQGAIDMAKAVLLVTTDTRIRNLAQSIVTEQQYEIQLMESLLAQTTQSPSPKQEKDR
jgi:uncharacterized protein (DUF305 family)